MNRYVFVSKIEAIANDAAHLGMPKLAKGILGMAIFFFSLSGIAKAQTITNDVTADVEVLGNPFTGYGQYVRNIWSLRAWNGLLYIGHGNANNTGPNPYSGDLYITVWNPTNSAFSNQANISEQQIDHFCFVTNPVLPGFNPNSLGGTGGTNGDFYVQEPGTSWKQFYTVPQAVHNFDMCYFSNTLFAALGTYYPTIVSSVNDGTNWSSAINPTILNNSSYRTYSLFAQSNVLYSMTGQIQTDGNITPCLLQYNPATGQFAAQGSINSNYFTNFCPNSGYNLAMDHIIARTTNIGPYLVYILGQIPNDINWDYPVGLFWCTNVIYGNKVNLGAGVQPWDIKANATNGNVVCVLQSVPVDTSGTNFLVQVNATIDFSNWTQVLQFTNESFARSFEILNGDLYFGVGCTTNLFGTNVGNLLRVQSQYFSTLLAPAVVWTNPAAIGPGTVLSPLQLNASANVAGTFTYTPNFGTILSAGTHTLTAVFIPTDTVDYRSVTNTVSILVYSQVTLQLMADGTVLLEAQGSPFEGFDIQASTNLINWLDLGIVLGDTNGLMQFDDIDAPNYNARFYLTTPQ